MYNLVVSFDFAERGDGSFDMAVGRLFEYTTDEIASPLRGLTVEARECLQSWPTLLMQEGRGQERAYLAALSEVHQTGSLVRFTASSIHTEPDLTNRDIWELRDRLDIGQFEFSRNHWAVKDRDLVGILRAADISVAKEFNQRSLPAFSRRELVRAMRAMEEWEHRQIDDFLLEIGIEELDPWNIDGTVSSRAEKIVRYSLNNPDATTAEDRRLYSAILKAVGRDVETSDRNDSVTSGNDRDSPRPSRHRPEEGGTGGRNPNRVFIVHGHNEDVRSRVVSFLHGIGLEGIILHEQPNMGRHLLTKFIDEAELVTFAVVLMTDDDVGSQKGGDLRPRTRQNVVLELGYFLAHLGQHRVCALITPGLETPSDFDGIVYIRLDEENEWQDQLLRELQAADMPIKEF